MTYKKTKDYYKKRKDAIENSLFKWRITARGLNDATI